ncbi:MAG: NUDIX domain-containing protein [Halobacteria archaeon]|nr:NUDIX domain-containing protein [Halobacteria archaeon]
MQETHVVTCFLRNRGEILLFERSDDVGSYTRRWGAVSGHVEDYDKPEATALGEIEEETGMTDGVSRVRTGETFEVVDDELGKRWVIHPYLFDSASRNVETNYETARYEWVPATEILERETVPELWKSYENVAPTVETVAGDTEHGSAYISVRALEVLRDTAATHEWDKVVETAEHLVGARPSMASLENRINKVMYGAETPDEVERMAREVIADAVKADEEASERAQEVVGGTVFTLSRSGTVLDALSEKSVIIAESRPACEGVDVAEELARDGYDVKLITDAAIPQFVAKVDTVLVGADTVLPDGSVVNKTGTRSAALGADYEKTDFYAVAASDKINTGNSVELEEGTPDEVYEGDAPIEVENPVFEVTPAELVTGIITEDGILDANEVAEVADELRKFQDW